MLNDLLPERKEHANLQGTADKVEVVVQIIAADQVTALGRTGTVYRVVVAGRSDKEHRIGATKILVADITLKNQSIRAVLKDAMARRVIFARMHECLAK